MEGDLADVLEASPGAVNPASRPAPKAPLALRIESWVRPLHGVDLLGAAQRRPEFVLTVVQFEGTDSRPA